MDSKPQRIKIQSENHEKLLNLIDDLRSQGISRYISLPEIIVVGDQSSGKSSVLEAISGLTFPTKDALCTRFATELVLRRSPETSSNASIVADASCSDEEKNQVANNFDMDGYDVYTDLGTIVESAGRAMGLDSTKGFSNHTLRIELTGPEQPHLTIVDLPGVFHSGSKMQSDADAAAVKTLVTEYMYKPRSVILAVVSAKNDVNNQIVIALAKEIDQGGSRTMGVITKPDCLPEGSDSEGQYFELAENKDVHLKLGWHVLKNRDYSQRDFTHDERNASEKEFFKKGIWTSLNPAQLGVDSLRPRLSQVLQGQILKELPSLLKDVQAGIRDCESRLDRLGTSRGTIMEQRLYLHAISEAFTNIVKEAVLGRYDRGYFGDATSSAGYLKRTRAVVSNMETNFAERMGRRGHKYTVVAEAPTKQRRRPPYKVTQEERLEGVRELIERNRGVELATAMKEENVTQLFKEQSSPWASIVKQDATKIFTTVKSSVMLALDATADQTTREAILSLIIGPELSRVKADFDQALDKILHHHINGRPITFNHYLTENLQKARAVAQQDHVAAVLEGFFGLDPRSATHTTYNRNVDLQALMNAFTEANEPDMTTFACKEVLATMSAYYKVALKNVVDDFAVYAVEQALMGRLEGLFPPSKVLQLDDDTIQDIAGETEETRKERAVYSKKLRTLKNALEILERLDRGNPQRTMVTSSSVTDEVKEAGSTEIVEAEDSDVDMSDAE